MEQWDVYDENRVKTGVLHTRGTPLPKGQCHMVVNIWTVNEKDQILLTKRHPKKPYGLMWECTGGSVLAGEKNMEGALRELREEVGIHTTADEMILLHTTKWKDRFIDTYITRQNVTLQDIRLQKEEVVDACFVTFEQLLSMWEMGSVIPKERFRLYRDKIQQYITQWEKERQSGRL